MATKTDPSDYDLWSVERLKLLLEEYLDVKQKKQQKEILDHIYGIFFWGMIFGVFLSYMSVFPVILGIVIGYIFSQKRWLMMEYWMEQWKPWIEAWSSYWRRWTSNDKF